MANPEHLTIFEQGVAAWNLWRAQNPTIIPNLEDADLREWDRSKSEVHVRNCSQMNLCGAMLRNANLSDANFWFADLKGANLVGADLRRASLTDADLTNADLSEACMSGVNLASANLNGTNFHGASVWSTVFAGNDLSRARGLDATRHYGPSFLSIDTIYKSMGKIPEVFLRGCGVPENFIKYMRSPIDSAQPIQFYTCFISQTEKDVAFVERLHNELQAAGVRCWWWKENAKWGKSLIGSVDEAIKVYDKVIVVCSKHSLKSPAVIREIERALQKEDDHVRAGNPGEVLFPIRLDDHLFKTWQHPRKPDVLAKNVGDFRQWKAPAAYQTALKRLIRDLAAEPAAAPTGGAKKPK